MLATYDEVVRSIMSLRNKKTPGDDNIPAEIIKHGRENRLRTLFHLIRELWEQKRFLEIGNWTSYAQYRKMKIERSAIITEESVY